MSTVVSIIVAMTPGGAIGRNGDLLFHISADLKRFKAVTMGKPVIMGRKTFESLPGGPLPGRRNIVITRQAEYLHDGIDVARSLDEALELVADQPEAMIIGGAEIYRLARDRADRAYLTLIDAEPEDADTFIEPFETGTWAVTGESDPMTDPRSGVSYKFVDLERRHSI